MSIFKAIRYMLSAFAAAVILAGCTSIQELPQESHQTEPQGGEYLLCRELLTAFLKDDGEKFCSLLPKEMQEKFPLKDYKAFRKSVTESAGEPVSFRYVTSLELTALTPHIWKIRFKRTNQRTQEEFFSEVLFRVIVGKIGDQPVITSFQFI